LPLFVPVPPPVAVILNAVEGPPGVEGPAGAPIAPTTPTFTEYEVADTLVLPCNRPPAPLPPPEAGDSPPPPATIKYSTLLSILNDMLPLDVNV
jgi:hypothetical protein